MDVLWTNYPSAFSFLINFFGTIITCCFFYHNLLLTWTDKTKSLFFMVFVILLLLIKKCKNFNLLFFPASLSTGGGYKFDKHKQYMVDNKLSHSLSNYLPKIQQNQKKSVGKSGKKPTFRIGNYGWVLRPLIFLWSEPMVKRELTKGE